MTEQQVGRVFDMIEEEYRNSTPENNVDRWTKFLEGYQIVNKAAENKTIIKRPYVDQIKRMSTASSLIYSRNQREEDNEVDDDHVIYTSAEKEIGRTIFILDYRDLVAARTDVFDVHMSEAYKKKEDKELRVLNIKVLCYQIRNYWDAAKDCIKKAVFTLLKKYDKKYSDIVTSANKIVVVVHGFEVTQAMGDISSQTLEKFVRIEALVPQFDDQASIEVYRTVWRCIKCEESTPPRPTRKPPGKCPYCEEKETLVEDVAQREVRDFMYFIAQDTTDKMRLGQMQANQRNIVVAETPFVKSVYNILEVGGYIAINGIVRLSEGVKNAQSNRGTVEIECIGIELLAERTKYSKRIRTLVEREIPEDQMGEHYEKLINSYAPHLYGLEVQKEILLLMGACGEGWKEKGGSSKIRGAMTTLLLGDSGTGKSELLNFHVRLNIHSNMVLGSLASRVGLTASIKKIETIRGGDKIIRNSIDPGPYGLTRGRGAYVCIDELDKVADPSIYEGISPAMDDFGALYLHKNAAHTRINVDCGSLHAANPVTGSGKYDTNESVFKQTNFATWLWSRYDFKCLFLSSKTEESRHMLWEHKAKTMNRMITESEYNNMNYNEYLNKRYESEGINAELDGEYYSFEYLSHELNYASEKYPDPELLPNSMPWLMMIKFWNRFNQISIIPPTARTESGGDPPFVPCLDERSINAMIRAAKSVARLHRSNVVTTVHMDRVLKLMRRTIKEFIPHVNLEELEEQELKDAKTLLNETMRKAMLYNTRVQNESIAKFAMGLTKVMKKTHYDYFDKCRTCGGKGFLPDKMGYSQDSAEKPMDCHHCNGTKGVYKKLSYNEFEKECWDTGTHSYCKDYFDLLQKVGILVKDSKAITTGIYYRVEKALNSEIMVRELQKQINLLFGVDPMVIERQKKLLIKEHVNK